MTVLDDSATCGNPQAEHAQEEVQATGSMVLSQLRELSILIMQSRKRAQRAERVQRGADDMARAFDCLDADELATLSSYLQRVIDNVEASMPDNEYAERRRAMREFLSLKGRGTRGGDLDA